MTRGMKISFKNSAYASVFPPKVDIGFYAELRKENPFSVRRNFQAVVKFGAPENRPLPNLESAANRHAADVAHICKPVYFYAPRGFGFRRKLAGLGNARNIFNPPIVASPYFEIVDVNPATVFHDIY